MKQRSMHYAKRFINSNKGEIYYETLNELLDQLPKFDNNRCRRSRPRCFWHYTQYPLPERDSHSRSAILPRNVSRRHVA